LPTTGQVSAVWKNPRPSFASYAPLADAVMARYALNEQLVRGVNMAELM
jgi:hypothetical protein